MPKKNVFVQGEVNDYFGIAEFATETCRNYGRYTVYGIEVELYDLKQFHSNPDFVKKMDKDLNSFREWIMKNYVIEIPERYDLKLTVNGDVERVQPYTVLKWTRDLGKLGDSDEEEDSKEE